MQCTITICSDSPTVADTLQLKTYYGEWEEHTKKFIVFSYPIGGSIILFILR